MGRHKAETAAIEQRKKLRDLIVTPTELKRKERQAARQVKEAKEAEQRAIDKAVRKKEAAKKARKAQKLWRRGKTLAQIIAHRRKIDWQRRDRAKKRVMKRTMADLQKRYPDEFVEICFANGWPANSAEGTSLVP